MRRVLTAFSAVMMVCICVTACSKQKDTSEIEILLNRWALAVKHLNYSEYSRLEAYPKDIHTFNAMYRQYYVADIKIVKVDEDIRNATDFDGRAYEYKNVKFISSMHDRQTNKDHQIINGDIKVIRYAADSKKGRGWLLSNRTLIYNQ